MLREWVYTVRSTSWQSCGWRRVELDDKRRWRSKQKNPRSVVMKRYMAICLLKHRFRREVRRWGKSCAAREIRSCFIPILKTVELDSEGQAHRAKARVGSKGLEWPRGPFLWRAGRRLPQRRDWTKTKRGGLPGRDFALMICLNTPLRWLGL